MLEKNKVAFPIPVSRPRKPGNIIFGYNGIGYPLAGPPYLRKIGDKEKLSLNLKFGLRVDRIMGDEEIIREFTANHFIYNFWRVIKNLESGSVVVLTVLRGNGKVVSAFLMPNEEEIDLMLNLNSRSA